MAYKKSYKKQLKKLNKTQKKKRTAKRQKTQLNEPYVFGVVHAKWCGHCQNLMNSPDTGEKSIWEKTKDLLSNRAEFVEIEDVVMNERVQEINNKYKVNLSVQGFPTIFKIKKGVLYTDFMGERTPESLAKWANAK